MVKLRVTVVSAPEAVLWAWASTVWGPVELAYVKLVIFERILHGQPITVFGDGEQTRGNTFVGDCIDGTLAAAERGTPGEVFNIGGGEARSVNWVIATLAELVGRAPVVQYGPPRPGDQTHTFADIARARQQLGYAPSTPMRDGLAAQVRWHRERSPALVASAA
jgi:nucleoside-diphosphate-sugar epimerase